jgi:hypothetical protein
MPDIDITDRLKTISEDGDVPESRIGNAWSLYQIWQALRIADMQSSYNRAQINACYDGQRPYSQANLAATGQSYRSNVNWGFSKTVLDTAVSGYVDIFNSTELIFECPTNYGNPDDRRRLEKIVAKEVTDCIRSWPDYFPTYLRLCTFFIKHGIGITYFMDEFDWRFKATDLSDFKIERDQEVGQDGIGIACCLRFYSPTQLYQLIKDPEEAEKQGYNVAECRKAIMKCASEGQQFARTGGYDWEKWEVLIKNNDIYWTTGIAQPQRIRVVHAWVQEFDGRVSHFMINDSEEVSEFLYKKIGRFDSVYRAYTVFPFGVGVNGYYQGIRGQGFDVAPIHSALDRAYNAMLELAMFSAAPIFQPESAQAMQEFQYTPGGPFSLITPGIEVKQLTPNIAQGIYPAMSAFHQMLRDRTGNANTQQLIDSKTEKTKFQVQAELGGIAKMSSSSLNLFYDPFALLVKEMVRRMKQAAKLDYGPQDPGGSYIVGLKKRLLQAGGQDALKAFYDLDIDRLTIVKAIGSGSEAARLMAMDRLMPFLNSMPDEGRQAFLFDVFADTLGDYRKAARYITPPGEETKFSPEVGVAQVESYQLLGGQPIQVIPGQNDAAHAREHLMIENPLVEQVQKAMELDPMSLVQLLPGLNLLDAHATQHVERLSRDQNYKELSAQMRKNLQENQGILYNSTLKVQKLMGEMDQQQQAQGEQQQEGQPQQDPAVIAKIQGEVALRQYKLESNQMLFEQKIHNNEIEARQKRSLADADAAAKMARELPGLGTL